MTDRIGKDDEIFLGVECCPGPNNSPAKAAVNMLSPELPVPCRTTTGTPSGFPIVR